MANLVLDQKQIAGRIGYVFTGEDYIIAAFFRDTQVSRILYICRGGAVFNWGRARALLVANAPDAIWEDASKNEADNFYSGKRHKRWRGESYPDPRTSSSSRTSTTGERLRGTRNEPTSTAFPRSFFLVYPGIRFRSSIVIVLEFRGCLARREFA
jgi:hypothetical protein